MRIIIDLQSAQGSHKDRGIGRYALALAQAIARNAGEHDIRILLSSQFPETLPKLEAAFTPEQICLWHPPPNRDVAHHEWHREHFIASLNPDILLLSSLFEGRNDATITSVNAYREIPTAVVLYDLIPLIHPEHYLTLDSRKHWYENKLNHLKRADLLLAISASAQHEAVTWLNFPSNRIHTISAAVADHFRPLADAQEKQRVSSRYGLHLPFVMYTGGTDPRKNIDGLIRAYAQLPPALRQQHQLAIVCALQDTVHARLTELAAAHGLTESAIIFTGFVPEADLITLYNACQVFAFPSWHEGFGLPLLEAMCCGKAVIAANTTSIPEIVGHPDALYDVHDDAALTTKLAQILTDQHLRQQLAQYSLQQAKHFSWDQTAQRTLLALTQLDHRHDTASCIITEQNRPIAAPL